MLQLLLSLFPGIASLHQLTSSSRTRIEKLPEQRLLCRTSSSAKVTVGTPGVLYSTLPVLSSLNSPTPESLLGFFFLPYLPRVMSSNLCFFSQSIFSVSFTFLGHVIEWKEHGVYVPRISVQILAYPPAGHVGLIASFLSFLLPHPSLLASCPPPPGLHDH